MNHSNSLPHFDKEFNKLLKRYKSLAEDLEKFERFIFENPTGLGKNFTIIHSSEKIKVVKARLMCKSLKDRSIRIIYAHRGDIFEFMYIEIYFKGDKENEDKERVREYLKNNPNT